jgi:thioredoxin reductase (NADPH)
MGLPGNRRAGDSIGHRGVYDAVIVGGGLAGLSAAIYLGRSRRDTLLIHSGHSMAKWEQDVQNYLGFPEGISGNDLLARGFSQVRRFDVEVAHDDIQDLKRDHEGMFRLTGVTQRYVARRVLLSTGLTHVPPDIPGVKDCLGKSLFFCKDCDAYRVQARSIVIIGWNNEAAEYALSMLLFSSKVLICTNGKAPLWDTAHAGWLAEYVIPVTQQSIRSISHDCGQISALTFDDGESLSAQAVFTTRGDVFHHELAEQAGAHLDEEGQIVVDHSMRTSVPGLYAAGCVTPANCQMIIAAGQGATAGQAINLDLFKEDLGRHTLPRGETVEWSPSKRQVAL